MRFVKETRIAAPPEAVFRFHESPGALLALIPPWERVKIVESTGSLRPGRRVHMRTNMGPIPIRMVSLHTEYEPPHLFADHQESGPFAHWRHRHQFLDDGQGGTILRDEIDYAPPLGFIGRWLLGGLIHRRLERMFDYRHATTKRLVEAGEGPRAATT